MAACPSSTCSQFTRITRVHYSHCSTGQILVKLTHNDHRMGFHLNCAQDQVTFGILQAETCKF